MGIDTYEPNQEQRADGNQSRPGNQKPVGNSRRDFLNGVRHLSAAAAGVVVGGGIGRLVQAEIDNRELLGSGVASKEDLPFRSSNQELALLLRVSSFAGDPRLSYEQQSSHQGAIKVCFAEENSQRIELFNTRYFAKPGTTMDVSQVKVSPDGNYLVVTQEGQGSSDVVTTQFLGGASRKSRRPIEVDSGQIAMKIIIDRPETNDDPPFIKKIDRDALVTICGNEENSIVQAVESRARAVVVRDVAPLSGDLSRVYNREKLIPKASPVNEDRIARLMLNTQEEAWWRNEGESDWGDDYYRDEDAFDYVRNGKSASNQDGSVVAFDARNFISLRKPATADKPTETKIATLDGVHLVNMNKGETGEHFVCRYNHPQPEKVKNVSLTGVYGSDEFMVSFFYQWDFDNVDKDRMIANLGLVSYSGENLDTKVMLIGVPQDTLGVDQVADGFVATLANGNKYLLSTEDVQKVKDGVYNEKNVIEHWELLPEEVSETESV